DLGCDASRQPADRASHERWARALAYVDALPDRDRRPAAREVLRHRLLACGKQAGAERLRAAQQLVQSRPSPDGKPDERRLQRERNQRADRQAQALTFEVDADDRDSGRESPHQLAKLVAAYHWRRAYLVLPTELVAVEDRVELRVHRRLEPDAGGVARAEVVQAAVAPHHVGSHARACRGYPIHVAVALRAHARKTRRRGVTPGTPVWFAKAAPK